MNIKIINKISFFVEDENDFFIFSMGFKDISFVTSKNIKEKIFKIIKNEKYILSEELASVSIQFEQDLVQSPNIGLYFLKLLAKKDIVIKKVVTTNNEFSILFHESELNNVIDILK